jgi:predicted aspartyl protease
MYDGGRTWSVALDGARQAMAAMSNCANNWPVNPSPRPIPVVPRPSVPNVQPRSRSTASVIPLRRNGDTYSLIGKLENTIPVEFVLDTGADGTVIPSWALYALRSAGFVVENRGTQKWGDAGGNKHYSQIVRLQQVQVGNFVGHNIDVTISDNDYGLLGQDFLRHFSSYKIDNKSNALELTE